jgi:hypothetical protein
MKRFALVFILALPMLSTACAQGNIYSGNNANIDASSDSGSDTADDTGTSADTGVDAFEDADINPDAEVEPIGLFAVESEIASLDNDVLVSDVEVVLASFPLLMTKAGPVVVMGQGNWFSSECCATGTIALRVDGEMQGTRASMGFQSHTQHPFAVDAVVNLYAGSHTVELIAWRSLGVGSFTVRATAQIAGLVGFSGAIQVLLEQDILVDAIDDFPITTLSLTHPGGDVYVEHTGTLERFTGDGDALSQFYLDGIWYSDALGINDLVTGYDEVAPVVIQDVFFNLPEGNHTLELRSSRLWYDTYQPDVTFNVKENSGLMAAWGTFTGHARTAVFEGIVGNESVVLSSTSFTLPDNHNGIVWVTVHGRWLDVENSGEGGLEAARLILDGNDVGPFAIQQFIEGYTISQRSFVLGYLARDLAPGNHTAGVSIRKAIPSDTNHNIPNLKAATLLSVLW